MCQRLQRYVGYDVFSVTPADGEDPERYAEHQFVPLARLRGVFRRGKFMVFDLGEEHALLAHNAMSGYWDELNDPWTFDYVEGKRRSGQSDVRALVEVMAPGTRETKFIQFHDSRKFGYLRVVSRAEVWAKLGKLGPDALDTPCGAPSSGVLDDASFEFALRSVKPVKDVLMDQSRIAGIGNIYAAEALWQAKVSPHRPAGSLGAVERLALMGAIRFVLRSALDRKLRYDELRIYRRRECPLCGGPVTSEKLKGRSTWWCPGCQK